MRKEAGYRSAKEFAEKMGMSVGTYTDYEQGRRKFTLEKAWEFADVLGCTLDDLAGRDFPQSGEASLDLVRAKLQSAFDELNATGQQEAVKRVQELTHVPDYTGEEKTTRASAGA